MEVEEVVVANDNLIGIVERLSEGASQSVVL
jgi:hypothetical protein